MKKALIILEKILVVVLCGILLAAPFSKHLVKILYYLALTLWVGLNILKYRSRFYKGLFSYTSSSGKAIAVFFLAAVISTIFSLKPYHSQEILFQRYFPYFILFFLGADLVRNSVGPLSINFQGKKVCFSNLSIIISSFLLLSIIVGLGGVWDYSRFHPLRLWTVFGKEIGTKMLPVYLVYLIPFNFAFFIYSKNKIFKIISFFTFCLLFFVLIFTGSRGALLAAIISLIFLVLFSRKKRYILFFLFLSIATIFVMPQYYQRRAKTLLRPADKYRFVARKKLFKFAGDIFITKPVFGAGVGMYELLPILAKDYPYGERVHLHVHNTYLEVLSEMGAVGLLAFLWIFVIFFKNVFRSIRLCQNVNTKAIQIGLVGSIIASLIFALSCTIITVGFQDALMFWILFGVSSGLISRHTRQPVLPEKASV